MKFNCRKINTTIAAILLTAALSGCYPSGNEVNRPSDNSFASPSDTSIDYSQNDNLFVSATPPECEITSAPVIELKVREWDNDAVINCFLNGKAITEKYEYDSDCFTDEMRYVYYTDDGYSLIFEPGRLSFRNSEKCTKFIYSFFESLYFDNDLDKLCADSEITSFSENEARSTVEEILEAFNITNVGTPYVFAFSSETANKIFAEWFNEADYVKWTEAEDAYLLVYQYEYEGIPVATNSIPLQGTDENVSETAIMAMVTKDEIVSFVCRNIYDENYTSTGKADINVTAEAALNLVYKSYNEIELTSPVSIQNCRLVYAPISKTGEKTCLFSPIWQFDVVTTSQRTQREYLSKEYINAQSGIRIY